MRAALRAVDPAMEMIGIEEDGCDPHGGLVERFAAFYSK